MKKSSIYLKTFSLMLSLGVVMSASAMAIASLKPSSSSPAQQTPSENLLARRPRFRARGVSSSRGRSGGTSRGPGMCYGEQITVTPLLPKINEQDSSKEERVVVESTVSPAPKFLISVDQTKATEAEFTLLNANGTEVIYQQEVSLENKTPGIITVSLPEPATEDEALVKVGQEYQWFFSVRCDPTDLAGDLIVEGRIKRIPKEDALAQELADATELEKPAVFAEFGVWTEAASSLAELLENNPDNPEIRANWQALLESANLGKLIEKDLVSSSESSVEN
ncbi:MAG: DUF928 domain-containing protein [Coleofasciculus sp. G3-WIS-01]|uniref:DUF928 domain-containing protein n=1 Tax=Coleofasciculus sp. G3-WIS-01 TaxID=3069528 RepID=UPI0032F64BA1